MSFAIICRKALIIWILLVAFTASPTAWAADENDNELYRAKLVSDVQKQGAAAAFAGRLDNDDLAELRAWAADQGREVSAALEKCLQKPALTEDWKPWSVPISNNPEVSTKLKELNALEIMVLTRWAGAYYAYSPKEASSTYKSHLKKYLQWQFGLAGDLEALQSLGHSREDAWLEILNLKILDKSMAAAQKASGYVRQPNQVPAAKLVIQGSSGSVGDQSGGLGSASYDPLYLSPDRGVIISSRPTGLVAYELKTGKELWRNREGKENTIIEYYIFNDYMYIHQTTRYMGWRAVIIETLSGRTIWQKDAVGDVGIGISIDIDGQFLAIFTDFGTYDLAIVPLKSDLSKEGTIKEYHLSDQDAVEKIISGLGIKKGNSISWLPCSLISNRISNYSLLLDDMTDICEHWGDETDPNMVWRDHRKQATQALKFSNGSPFKFSAIRKVPNRYREINDDGEGLAVTIGQNGTLTLADSAGDIHLFQNGRHTASFTGDMRVRTQGRLKEYFLRRIIDDTDPMRPVCTLAPLNKPEQGLAVRFDLAKGTIEELPGPAAESTLNVVAISVSALNNAAIGLEDGSLWRLNFNSGQLNRLLSPTTLAWAAFDFSPDGRWLAAADRSGQVYRADFTLESPLFEPLFKTSPPVGLIRAGREGRKIWTLTDETKIVNDEFVFASRLVFWNATKGQAVSGVIQRQIKTLAYDQNADETKLFDCHKTDDEDKANMDVRRELVELNAVNAKLITLHSYHGTDYNGFEIIDASSDGQSLLIGFFEGDDIAYVSHYLMNTDSGQTLALDFANRFVSEGLLRGICAWPSSNLAAVMDYNTLHTVNAATGTPIIRGNNNGESDFNSIHCLTGQPRLLSQGDNGFLQLWDLTKPEPANVLSWIFFKNGNYAVIDADSRFDTSNIDQLEEGIHWVVSRLPDQTMTMPVLWRDYYQPRLAEYVLAGKKLPELRPIDQLNLNQHGVRLVEVKPEEDVPGKVAVTVEVYVRGEDAHHPAQELKLFRDGQLVGKYSDENGGLFDLPDGKRQVTFRNIALPQNKNQVMFKAWAFNNDGVRSKYFDRPYEYQPAAKASPRMHVIALGVNNFDNPAWDLKLAVNDAKGYADILPARLPGVKSDVKLLASGEGLTKPTKGNLKAAVEQLADGGSSPDDIVVLTIASHGLTDDKDNQFYILPADIPGQEKRITPDLLTHSISTEELTDWLTGVDAGEFIMILDTCQSGAALGGGSFKPGPMGDKGLGQLAYDKAMRVLTATNENNAAMEVGNLGHGLLSYALLIDGLERGQVGGKSKSFTFSDWLAYGKERTAELYAKIAKGENLGETRGRARVDKTADNANPPLGQEPYLFDFAKQSDDAIRLQIK